LRKGLPWSHPHEEMDAILFDLERDKPLMEKIRQAIQHRL